MAVPAMSTPAGPLEMVETYVFYEAPRLFCARSNSGQRYLGIFVDEDETSETYLYVPMSDDRFIATRSGLLSVRDSVVAAEAPILSVRTTYGDDESETEEWSQIESAALRDEWLPDPEAILQLPTPTQQEFTPAALAQRSTAEGRTLLGLRLPDASLRTEYAARDVVAFIGRVQDATSSLGQEIRGHPTTAGMLPGDVLDETELALVELQAASFVVILTPTARPIGQLPLEPPLARQSLDYLLNLAEAAGEDAAFRAQVSELHRRAKKKLHDFFETIVDVGAPITLALARPNDSDRNVELTVGNARLGLAVLAETEEDSEELPPFSAHLIGVNLRTKSYEVNRISDGQKFSGGMEPGALDMISGKPTGEDHEYEVVIRKEISVDAVTGEERPRFRLLSIAQSTSSTDGTES